MLARENGALKQAHFGRQDLAHGAFDKIVNDALRRGLDNCLAESSRASSPPLADAARLTRRDEIARKVLLGERHALPARAPQSTQAYCWAGSRSRTQR